MASDSSPLVSVSEAASFLGTSERTVRKWLARHNLEARREIRSGRSVLVLDLELLCAATSRSPISTANPAHKLEPSKVELESLRAAKVELESLRESMRAECKSLERELVSLKIEEARVRALLCASEKQESRMNAYADKLEARLEHEHHELRRLERLVGQLSGERDSLREAALREPASLWGRFLRLFGL